MIRLAVLFIMYTSGGISALLSLYGLVYTEKPVISVILQLVFAAGLIFTAFTLRQEPKKESIELILSGKLTVYIAAYVFFLPFTGYLLSTTIFSYLLNRDYSQLWTDCLLMALIVSITNFIIFKYLLLFTPELGWLFAVMGKSIW